MFGTSHLEQMLVDLRKVDESVNQQLTSLRQKLEITNALLRDILTHLEQAAGVKPFPTKK